MPEPSAPPYRFQLRVYWEDTDAGGVVFYANYLKFFERARTEWLRSLGHSQERLRIDTGAMFVVTDTAVRFLRPARLDDLLAVTVQVVHAGRAQMTIAQQAWRSARESAPRPTTYVVRPPRGMSKVAKPHLPMSEVLLAEGTIRIGCVDAGTFRPTRIPISILDSLTTTIPLHPSAAGRAPGRFGPRGGHLWPLAGPRPLGEPADAPVGRGAP